MVIVWENKKYIEKDSMITRTDFIAHFRFKTKSKWYNNLKEGMENNDNIQ